MNNMEISEELEKEFEKLKDLEFEYNLISKFADDEGELAIAKGKYRRQANKIRKMEEELYAKQNIQEESDIKAQEE